MNLYPQSKFNSLSRRVWSPSEDSGNGAGGGASCLPQERCD